MKASQNIIARTAFLANRGGILVSETALLGLMLLTVYAVLTRYIFYSPSVHALEISQYLLLAISWMSIGWVLLEGKHVCMEALYNTFPNTLKKIADIINNFAILLFCITLMWAGSVNVVTAFDRGYRSSSLLSFPMWVPYLLVPIGGSLLSLAVISHMLKKIKPIDR